MSGIIKGIVKVFKKVVKVVLKVLPYVVAAAAVVFTAGAALGASWAVGGWTAAAGNFVGGTLGLSGTLGNVAVGALKYAGYGALTGGAVAAVTGGNIGQGITAGALTGAVTGGVLGYMNPDALSNAIAAGKPAPTTTGVENAVSGTTDATTTTGSAMGKVEIPTPKAPTVTGGETGGAAYNPANSPEVLAAKEATKGVIAGQVISGLGRGLTASAAAGAEADKIAQRKANYDYAGEGLLAYEGDEQPIPVNNDGTDIVGLGGRLTQYATPQAGRYEVNPQTGRLVYIPPNTGVPLPRTTNA